MIMKHLESAVEKVRELGYTPVYAALYGSQNYGLDVYGDDYQSDYDVKVIVMPSLHNIVFGKGTISTTVDYDGGQIDIKDAVTMMNIICKMNTQYLELLLTPFYLVFPGGEYMEEVRALLPNLLSERAPLFARATYGHFKEKIAKAQHISPSSEERIRKHGYDGKQLHHALRLKLMLEDYERTGRMVLHPPSDQVAYLSRLKKNELPIDEVMPLLDLWNADMIACVNRIIASKNDMTSEEAADSAMSLTRNALYMALKSDAMGIQTVLDAKEVKADE